MPPKNSAERQRKYVEMLKADGKYEEFKEKKAEYRNEYNRKKRDSIVSEGTFDSDFELLM